MGLINDLLRLNELQNESIRAENKLKREDKKKWIRMELEEKMMKAIEKKGFSKVGITLEDLMGLSEKYDLRWSEEEVLECMNSKKPLYNLWLLPMPFLIWKDFNDDLFNIYLEKNKENIEWYVKWRGWE